MATSTTTLWQRCHNFAVPAGLQRKRKKDERSLKDVTYLFYCQEHLKHFSENYQFYLKSGNDSYSSGWGVMLFTSLWPIAYENRHVTYLLLSQKMFSTLSIKHLQKSQNGYFKTLRTFIFDLKIASADFSEVFSTTKFQFGSFFLVFPKYSSNLVTQKCIILPKIIFSNAQNIRFWLQESFKSIL